MAELFDVTLNAEDNKLDRDELLEAMRNFDVLVPTVTDRIDADMLAQAAAFGGKLKLIASYGAGVDHLDVHAARKRGILISNTPGVVAEDTADMTLALILAVSLRLAKLVTAPVEHLSRIARRIGP